MSAHDDKVDVVFFGVTQYFVSRSPLDRYRPAGYALLLELVINLCHVVFSSLLVFLSGFSYTVIASLSQG